MTQRKLIHGAVILLAFALIFSGSATGGQSAFVTNTPSPTEFSFATNTPEGPTPTHTPSPSPTSTPTNTPTPSPTPTDTPTPTPTPIGPFFYPEGINPLTGLPYPNKEAMERRNLIVKISNFPPIVRPQTGINQADVVYELEAEGGVTRFAAIFRSNAPTMVGSIRSARLVDIELATMYNALLAYSGTSEPIQKLLLSEPFFQFQLLSPSIGDNCEEAGFCRFPKEGLAFEHTLFGDTTKMWALATRRNVNVGRRALGFAFNEKPDPNGAPALDIFIDWWGQTDARWQYDAATGRYLRYTDGVAHYDAGDQQQIWADNLVIIEVPHNNRPDLFPEGANYTSLEIALWDQGLAYLARDGQVYNGYWRRRSTDFGDALQIIYGNNVPIMMKPGRTWVSVVRNLSDARISDQQADMRATATAIFLNATPTPLQSPTPEPE